MKAVVFEGTTSLGYRMIEEPKIEKGHVLIQVKACGICGTDQHIYHGQPGSAEVTPPRILGHEFAGEIVKLGEDVNGFNLGDRVSIDPNIYCYSCEYCQNGKHHLCNQLEALGVTIDGGMGEYCLVPVSNCYLLPDQLSYKEGALLEPLGCVLHGIKQLEIKPGASVMIIGGGFIGQLMLQVVNMYGCAPVIVCEPDSLKHKRIVELGADKVLLPAEAEGHQADIVIECVGKEVTIEQAVRSTKKGGQILLFGVASPKAKISISPFEVFSKELTIKGSFINPNTHRQAISLVSQGKIKVEPLISHSFKLDEIPEKFEVYHQLGVVKGMIEF